MIISYSLVNCKVMYLFNFVYICDVVGKVVIIIEVNELGKIICKEYNVILFIIINGCLIDVVLVYVVEICFSMDVLKER